MRYNTDVNLTLKVSMQGGKTFSLKPATQITLGIAAVSKPTSLQYGLSAMTGKLLNVSIPFTKSFLGTSMDIGIDNPFDKFKFSMQCSVTGSWYFGIGAETIGVAQYFKEQMEQFDEGVMPTKEEQKAWR